MKSGDKHVDIAIGEKMKKIIKPGMDSKDVNKFYDDWAASYNKDLMSQAYHSPVATVAELLNIAGSNHNIRILDVAAGTGLVGTELKKQGFKNVDALDANDSMLVEAKKTGAYKSYICAFLGSKKTEIKDGSYDTVITTGSFVPSHLNEDCFEELIRITRPGGYIIIMMNQMFFDTEPQYTEKLECRMEELHALGSWEIVSRKKVPHYRQNSSGVCIVLKV